MPSPSMFTHCRYPFLTWLWSSALVQTCLWLLHIQPLCHFHAKSVISANEGWTPCQDTAAFITPLFSFPSRYGGDGRRRERQAIKRILYIIGVRLSFALQHVDHHFVICHYVFVFQTCEGEVWIRRAPARMSKHHSEKSIRTLANVFTCHSIPVSKLKYSCSLEYDI